LVDPTGTAYGPAWAALTDDLNVPKAMGELFSAEPAESDADGLYSLLYALGLEADLPEAESVDVPDEITALAEERLAARAAKDCATNLRTPAGRSKTRPTATSSRRFRISLERT